MTAGVFAQILENASTDRTREYCRVLEGLKIMSNYIKPGRLVGGADHDIIYGPDVEDLLSAGMTEEDAEKLGSFGWHYDTDIDSIAIYV